MRICFVANSFGIGGLERVVAALGEKLQVEGFAEIYYYSFSSQPVFWHLKEKDHFFKKSRQPTKADLLLTRSGKLIEMLSKGNFNINKYQRDFISEIIKLINSKKLSILVVTSAQQIAAIPLIKKACPQIKIVAWLHQSCHAIFKLSKKFEYFFKEGLKIADCIVTLTKEAHRFFSRLNKFSVLIVNPLLLDFHGRKAHFGTSKIAFVSRITFDQGQKGLDFLAEIAKLLPAKYTIEIAGNGDQKNQRRFSKLIHKKGVAEKISWQGSKSGEDLLNHYTSSSAFISTSRTEAFSLVILEAMGAGLPVISFKTSGANELLQDGISGKLIANFNIEQFVHELVEILRNEELFAHYQEASLKRAQDFRMTEVVNQWKKLLTELNGKRS
ncbi:glycosyltransferase [Liquorilactobacillus oeni]|nr:glycosyltransferase [Liquorilactobacillus oeni]